MEFKPFKSLRIKLKPPRNISIQTHCSAMVSEMGKLFCFICCREELHQQPVQRNGEIHEHDDDEENMNLENSKDDANIKKVVSNFIKRVIRYKKLSHSKAQWLSNEDKNPKSESDLHACKSCAKIIKEINTTDSGLATVIAKAHEENTDQISDLWMVMNRRLNKKIQEVYNIMQNVEHRTRRYCETYWDHRAVEFEIKEIVAVDLQGFRKEFMGKFQNQNAKDTTEKSTEIAATDVTNNGKDSSQMNGESSQTLPIVAQTSTFPNQPSCFRRRHYTTHQVEPAIQSFVDLTDTCPLAVENFDDNTQENAISQNHSSRISSNGQITHKEILGNESRQRRDHSNSSQPPPSKKQKTTKLSLTETGCNTENNGVQNELDNLCIEKRCVRKRHFTTNEKLQNSKTVQTPLVPLVNSNGSSSDTTDPPRSKRGRPLGKKSSVGSAKKGPKLATGMTMPSSSLGDNMNMLKGPDAETKPTKMETRSKPSLPRKGNLAEEKLNPGKESSTTTTKPAERKKKVTINVPKRKFSSKKIQTAKKNAKKSNASSQERKSSTLNYQKKKCSKCNKTFSNRYNLAAHHKNIHEGKKAFVCELCGERFSQNSNLNRHRGGERCTSIRESGGGETKV